MAGICMQRIYLSSNSTFCMVEVMQAGHKSTRQSHLQIARDTPCYSLKSVVLCSNPGISLNQI